MIKTPHGHNRYSAISSLLPDGAEKGGCAARSLDRAFKVVPALEKLEVDRIFFSRPPSLCIQSLYDALSTRVGSEGQLTTTQHVSSELALTSGQKSMVRRWESG